MWSNISAPKSGLKLAHLGSQSIECRDNNVNIMCSKQAQQHGNGSSPLMRFKHAVCSSPAGFIYIHGGRFGNGVPLDDDLWRFDAHSNTWIQLNTSGCKPPSLQEHTLVEYNDHLYLFGGQLSATNGQENSFWRLDLITREWSTMNMASSMRHGAYLGPSNKRGHSACVYRNSMYIFGGYEDFRGSSAQLWQFDLLDERWELRNLSATSACQPEARHSHSACVWRDSMFVYGGLSNLKPLGDLWRWSWKEKRWFKERTRGRSPGPLHGHSAVQAFGSMFVFGGERVNGRPTRSVWRLNLANLCWQKIKPKGPRPNPTTWHAAVANPLDILDAANYLVEGNACDSQLLANDDDVNNKSSSSSSTSTPSSPSNARAQHLPQLDGVRPTNDNSLPMPLTSSSLTSSSSTSWLMQHKQKHDATQSIRRDMTTQSAQRSKLTNGEPVCCSIVKQKRLDEKDANNSDVMAMRTKVKKRLKLSLWRKRHVHLPASQSAIEIVTPKKESNASDKQHSNQAEKCESQAAGPQTILDNLDTDIKQMFQSIESGEPLEETLKASPSSQSSQSSSSTCLHGSFVTTSKTTSLDYQTAREQLTSQSTLTITNTAADKSSRRRLSTATMQHSALEEHQVQERIKSDAAPINLDETLRPMRDQLVARRRNQTNRPKSEIVQSLIDRADAKIKNLYTPHFNFNLDQQQQQQQKRQQQRRSVNLEQRQQQVVSGGCCPLATTCKQPLNVNDLQNRIFNKLNSATSGARMDDKSKRHTIHQTMTYYNLYFSERLESTSSSSSCGENSNDLQQNNNLLTSQQQQQQRQQLADDSTISNSLTTSSATIKNISTDSQAATWASTSAALVGVRDVTPASEATTSCRVGSQTGRVQTSSLCNADDDSMRHDDDCENCTKRNLCHEDDDDDRFARAKNASELGDSTSLSFSAIAEFEEDDMLQYSSPTDEPHKHYEARTSGESSQMDCDMDERTVNDDDDKPQVERQDKQMIALHAQKSTSSGYDSIQSACSTSGPPPNDEILSDSSQVNQQPKQEQRTTIGNLTSSASSATTADSHVLLSTCTPSRSLPASPPERRYLAPANPPPPPSSTSRFNPTRLFASARAKRRSGVTAKTRYWQLCMFVIGGKQAGGNQVPGAGISEPINIWRLYI